MKALEGKVSLVTGGSRGIGRATALALTDAGSDVAINFAHAEEAAQEVCEQLSSNGAKVKCYKANVSDEREATEMIRTISEEMGPIQILVNNAGITRDKSFVKMTRLMWDEVMGVNLNGPFNVTHATLPMMIDTGWGRVINVASIVGQTGAFGQANYSVTKGGLISFTMTLAREVARKGVTVNAVAPGYIETDMTKKMPDDVMDQVKSMTPLGRLGSPNEVASVITFLASPASSYVTGQVLAVNGGMYM